MFLIRFYLSFKFWGFNVRGARNHHLKDFEENIKFVHFYPAKKANYTLSKIKIFNVSDIR